MTRREEWRLLRRIRDLEREVEEVRSWNYRQGESIIRLLNEKQALLKEISP